MCSYPCGDACVSDLHMNTLPGAAGKEERRGRGLGTAAILPKIPEA